MTGSTPGGAFTLVRKPESKRMPVPDTMDATWRIIALAQSEAR
jgi:hypothetical protein